ncbi:hypothetical protein HanXRQr2_Chr16g0755771 [Helianthus annuus]|uniref:Uncharacterized protein n=1 Tax=Helianthus annuus TaxID=4232 RepID=A0A9K3DS41_HELAN|nr:hypothetical protein HanXRQr2_Chr16g0755771 [Helianthus annuus]KAJ0443477.1 hypothetical protein HanIR_Chr16g0821181 [Helianthus annuus]KAJ0821786.1 hypothetical protein HanPSC8_Chr16g0724291 [Helianthus annuus]
MNWRVSESDVMGWPERWNSGGREVKMERIWSSLWRIVFHLEEKGLIWWEREIREWI